MLLTTVVLAAFAVSLFARARLSGRAQPPAPAGDLPPQRLVSMSPNLTEMLFMLGLGDRVVGVTRYCTRPPAARQRPKIGGHLDPNFEAVVALRPELVVLLREQSGLVESFEKLGIPTSTVSDNGLSEIFAAIGRIGAVCGVGDRARRITADMRRRVKQIRRRTAGRPRPRVLLVIDRTLGTGTIEDAYIAGSDEYFEQLIHLAGGRNAYRGPDVAYPVVSAEGLIHMDAEVIIDFSVNVAGEKETADHLADWQTLPELSAVRRGRVYALRGEGILLPGPRTVDLLDKLAARIHAGSP